MLRSEAIMIMSTGTCRDPFHTPKPRPDRPLTDCSFGRISHACPSSVTNTERRIPTSRAWSHWLHSSRCRSLHVATRVFRLPTAPVKALLVTNWAIDDHFQTRCSACHFLVRYHGPKLGPSHSTFLNCNSVGVSGESAMAHAIRMNMGNLP